MTCWCWPGCTAPRWTTSGSGASPRSPGSAASRSGSRSQPGPSFGGDPRLGRAAVPRRSGPPCPSWSAGSGNGRTAGGHARLDYTQNAGHKTLVAPYSPRPAAGAPISAPIDWDELDDPSLRPDGVTVRTAFDRLADRGDPFRSVLNYDQTLPPIT